MQLLALTALLVLVCPAAALWPHRDPFAGTKAHALARRRLQGAPPGLPECIAEQIATCDSADDRGACMSALICEVGLDRRSCSDEDSAEIDEEIGAFCEGGDGALRSHPFCHALAGYWPASD